jgi:predicted nucleotidyltransferase
MNENQIADIWMLFKEYVDKKLIEAVAERYVDLLADLGVSDKVMESATGIDDDLDTAIEYYLDQGNEEEEDFEEDNWDYEDDE